MTYSVLAESIAKDVKDDVKEEILDFLKTYDFPYVTAVRNKSVLKKIFTGHFENRRSLEWLKQRVYAAAGGRNLTGPLQLPDPKRIGYIPQD